MALQIAVLSTSRIVAEVMREIGNWPEVEVTAIVCRPQSAEKAHAWAAEYGVPAVYTDEAAAYAAGGFDAVYIGTANHLHYAAAKRALQAGYHVLLEKPFALNSDETLLIVSLGICFGMVLLADALGFSSALGAFLAGSLLAGTVHAERVEHLTAGVKDLFGAVFFISVGMMLNPGAVVEYAVPILILTLVTIVGKLIFSSLGVLLSGHTLRQAIHCGCALAQIGEFAFIIASLGLSLGVIADYIYPIIISVSVITTLTTPFFIKSADSICNGIEKLLPEKLVQKLDSYTDAEQAAKEHGIPLKTIHITTKEAAQNVPAPVTTYDPFRDGKFVTQGIQSDKKLLALAGVKE